MEKFKKSFALYVGSNNETKKLEIEKITKIVGEAFDGFTITKGIGFWRGVSENMAIVAIYGEEEKIKRVAQTLRIELNQEAVGIQETAPMSFI